MQLTHECPNYYIIDGNTSVKKKKKKKSLYLLGYNQIDHNQGENDLWMPPRFPLFTWASNTGEKKLKCKSFKR